jgi:hypothetical protein
MVGIFFQPSLVIHQFALAQVYLAQRETHETSAIASQFNESLV